MASPHDPDQITSPPAFASTISTEVPLSGSSIPKDDLQALGVTEEGDIDPKTGLRRMRADKKTAGVDETSAVPTSVASTTVQPSAASSSSTLAARRIPAELKPAAQPIPISPRSPYHTIPMAASPGLFRSHSPRLHSPAESEIFERNVQEPVTLAGLTSDGPAHIPSHVITEDFIPPALEASAQAITSEDLNPDEVEIVTSTAHLPAVSSMVDSTTSLSDVSQPSFSGTVRSPPLDENDPASILHPASSLLSAEVDDTASNYGQLDPNDVRRLSFISFADIVQSEHQNFGVDGASQTSLGGHHASFSSATNTTGNASFSAGGVPERTASPIRSPRSPRSPGSVTTPPLPAANVGVSGAGGEHSLARTLGVGSLGGQHGELTIETMRQAVRKTASGDLSGIRSAGMSPI